MTNNQYFPDIAIPPGESLKELLEEMDITQSDLATRMGRPVKTISEIVNGKAKITADTAIQLEKVLGVSATFWINLQSNYEEDLARLREKELLEQQLGWLKNFPIKKMIENGWIEEKKDKREQLKTLFEFFSVADLVSWNGVWAPKMAAGLSFRKSDKFELSDYSLAAWLREGEIVSKRIGCKDFNAKLLRKKIPEIRTLTTEEPEKFIPQLKDIGKECGVAFVFVKELPKLPVYGVTYWSSSNKAVVQLTIRQKTDDHLWFSVFHEIGHILLHGKRDFYGDNAEWEEEANQFANESLIPSEQYQRFVNQNVYSSANVRSFAQIMGVSPGIVVGRLQHDKIIGYNKLNGLKTKFEWT